MKRVSKRAVTFLLFVGLLGAWNQRAWGLAEAPAYYAPVAKIGSFISDGKTPVVITLGGYYPEYDVLDGAVNPTAGPSYNPAPLPPTGQDVSAYTLIFTSVKGPGVMIFATGTTPPIVGYPHTETINAAAWNPDILAATAGPYWPEGWPRTTVGGGESLPGAKAVGTVTVKVLPAGSYDIYGGFGTGSLGAPPGIATIRYPYVFLTSLSTSGGLVTPSLPMVSLSVVDSLATEGTNDTGGLKVSRTGGDTTQALSVTVEAGVPTNALNATAFPTTDYTLQYAQGAVTPGADVTPTANSDGTFTVVIPANVLSVNVTLTAKLTPPHPQTPVRPAIFKLVASSAYTIGS